MVESKDAECVRDAQLTVFDSGPELLLQNSVLSVALRFSQDTMDQLHSSYFTVTEVKLEKKHMEMQEDTQEGKK